jgi:hypothetical protein
MERILGVTYDASKHKTHEHWVESRIHTIEAEALDQAKGHNQARTRYQRMFWEPVVEGQVCYSHTSFLLVVNHLTSSGTYTPRCFEKGTRRRSTKWAV